MNQLKWTGLKLDMAVNLLAEPSTCLLRLGHGCGVDRLIIHRVASSRVTAMTGNMVTKLEEKRFGETDVDTQRQGSRAFFLRKGRPTPDLRVYK